MEFSISEVIKFTTAGGLVIFIILRLFSFLEKRETLKSKNNGNIDRSLLIELKNYMANLNHQMEEHAKESRQNFQRVEDQIAGITE